MRNILKIFSGVIILVLVSKCLGFVRESFVATIYGAGYISDVYVIEDGLINAIYTVCAGVISTTYIPKILELNKKKKDAFTQITPQLKHVITNCCVSRDIRILPPKPTPSKTELPKVTTGSQVKYNYPISDNKSTAKAEEVPDDLMDFECDIDDE